MILLALPCRVLSSETSAVSKSMAGPKIIPSAGYNRNTGPASYRDLQLSSLASIHVILHLWINRPYLSKGVLQGTAEYSLVANSSPGAARDEQKIR